MLKDADEGQAGFKSTKPSFLPWGIDACSMQEVTFPYSSPLDRRWRHGPAPPHIVCQTRPLPVHPTFYISPLFRRPSLLLLRNVKLSPQSMAMSDKSDRRHAAAGPNNGSVRRWSNALRHSFLFLTTSNISYSCAQSPYCTSNRFALY